MTAATKKSPRRRWARRLHVLAIFLLTGLVLAAGFAGFSVEAEAGRIVPGVSIANVEVGGLNMTEATTAVEAAVRNYQLEMVSGDARFQVAIASPETGLTKPAATYDIAVAVDKAMAIGRNGGTIASASNRVQSYVFGTSVDIPVVIDHVALADAIRAKMPPAPAEPKDAAFNVDIDANGNPQVTIVPEQPGRRLDIESTLSAAEDRIAHLMATPPVALRFNDDVAQIKASDLEPLRSNVPSALDRAPLELQFSTLRWTVTKRQLASWLTAVRVEGSGYRLGIDTDKAGADIKARAASVATAPQDAVFEMTGDHVTNFVPSVDGEAVDETASATAVDAAVFGAMPSAQPLDLPPKTTPPAKDTASSNQWGIKEIIGIGESNFKGSPKNRRTNISVGAKALDGVIIPADAEFSLMKTLGTIDGTSGYVKELVIKKNKTVPEYGGGLCQIGTTTFRTVLDAGLPVTMRQNHSYRVTYYERDGAGKLIGPGKDATIYDPWPDFKFKNDTGHAIMIRTAMNGDRLTFTFWGVKDGRKAEQTVARVYNVTQPPPKKEIPTTDLPPGQKKCTETAHAGADATFTYTVTYADGAVHKKDFNSHYVPWGEVCLIGTDPSAMPPADTSTTLPSADAVGADGTPPATMTVGN